jgi:hypothetical protein
MDIVLPYQSSNQLDHTVLAILVLTPTQEEELVSQVALETDPTVVLLVVVLPTESFLNLVKNLLAFET